MWKKGNQALAVLLMLFTPDPTSSGSLTHSFSSSTILSLSCLAALVKPGTMFGLVPLLLVSDDAEEEIDSWEVRNGSKSEI